MSIYSTTSAVQNKRHIRGQGMTEYIIIVALIALASIASVSYFGTAIKAQFVNMAAELTGSQSGAVADVKSEVGSESSNATSKATLDSY